MKIEWKSCFRVGASVFALYLCIHYWPWVSGFAGTLVGAAAPLFIGGVIAYVINIPMSFYEKHFFPKTKKTGLIKARRPICMLAAFLSLVVIIAALIRLVVPELAASVELLVSQIPGVVDSFLGWLEDSKLITEESLEPFRNVDWQTKLEQILSVLTTGVSSVMGTAVNVVSSVFSGIVTSFLAAIFSIYLLAGKEKLKRQFDRMMTRYMKGSLCAKIKHVLSVLNDCFHRYIVGQCTEAVILGVLCALGMVILGIPYATMTGAVIAFTALIPVAGAYIGAAVGALMILTVSPMKAVVFLVFLVIIQQVEGNLIYPRVVGSSMGLPAIWVLAAVTVGGGVMGIAGMLLGVPLAAALYRLLRESVNQLPPKERSSQ